MSVINSTLSRENVVVQEDAKLSYSEPMERHLPSRRRPSKKFITSASTVEGSHGRDVRVGAVDIPEMERQNMSGAEGEQCALDHFWGLVANQEEQAEATAAMDTEDRRSQAVRAQIKKEERYTMWEQEDMRTRETRTAMRQYLEEAARREYLEVCVSTWICCFPARSSLQNLRSQGSRFQLSSPFFAFRNNGGWHPTLLGHRLSPSKPLVCVWVLHTSHVILSSNLWRQLRPP